MSHQKGNASRSRAQKYQNTHTFKNNLYDTSHKTKAINNIHVVDVCERCKKIIEWKIKYKKFKPLKTPSKCTKCEQKCVKHAYHIMCEACAMKLKVCPKCGEKGKIIKQEVEEDPIKLDRELRLILKKLPERKRRTFLRYMNRNGEDKRSKTKSEHSNNDTKVSNKECNEESNAIENNEEVEVPFTREDLLAKLQLLLSSSKRKNNDDDYDNDDDDDDDFSSNFNGDISYNSSDIDADNKYENDDENDADDSDSDHTNNKSNKK